VILDYDGKGLESRPRLVTSLRANLTDQAWPYVSDHRQSIDADWRERTSRNPRLFNGDVLMSKSPRFEGETAEVPLFAARYAELMHWQARTSVDGVRLPYAIPVPITRDGGYVLGQMGAHTANAGMAYFPSGTLSAEDLADDGEVDLRGAMIREIVEECGLPPEAMTTGSTWLILETSKSLACFLPTFIDLGDAEVHARFDEHVRESRSPELEGIRIARTREDLHGLELPIVQKRFFDLLFGGHLAVHRMTIACR